MKTTGIENRLLLKHLIEKLGYEHEIELRDEDNHRLFTCSSNSQILKNYLDREVVEWFVSSSKAFILIGEQE